MSTMAVNIAFLNLLLVLHVALLDAYVPGMLTVTPMEVTAEETLELDKCYDRSDVTNGGYHKLCKPFRRCLPASDTQLNKHLSYFRSQFVYDFFGTEEPSFVGIDSSVEQHFGSLFDVLKNKKSEKAKTCFELGSYFACGAFYPFCHQQELQDGKVKAFEILPCRDVCEKAQNACEKELSKLGFRWPADELNCAKFPTKSCAPAPLANCHDPAINNTNSGVNTDNDTDSVVNTNNDTSTVNTTHGEVVIEPIDETTEGETCPQLEMPGKNCSDCRKKVREMYSKNLISKKLKLDFLANVEVLNKFVENFKGKCRFAYNVSIINNYNVSCDNVDEYHCGKVVTVYSGDAIEHEGEHCIQCITPIIKIVPNNRYVIGGFIEAGEWFLDGQEKGCLISKDQKKAKNIDRWIGHKSCGMGRSDQARGTCSV